VRIDHDEIVEGTSRYPIVPRARRRLWPAGVALTAELLPTSIPSAVAGWRVVADVLGSTSGLWRAGTLADALDSFGGAWAACASLPDWWWCCSHASPRPGGLELEG
jgi:hypothetical protein